MNAGFRAAGYSGVRSTPGTRVSTSNSTRIAKDRCCTTKKGKGDDLTKHDWNVRQKEDQIDQVMLAFPNRQSHCDGLESDYSFG